MHLGIPLLATVLLLSIQPSLSARFCGRRLVSVLTKLCKNGFRSSSVNGITVNGYYRRTSHLLNYQRRGIVHECCHMSCGIETLRQYCADSDKIVDTTTPPTTTVPTTPLSHTGLSFKSLIDVLKELVDNEAGRQKNSPSFV